MLPLGDFDRGADGWFISFKGQKGQKFFDDAQKMVDFLAKNKVTEAYEEVDLDEAPRRKGAPKMGGDSIAIQRAKDS